MAKIMISMPEEMEAKIERLARSEFRSKSELLREALRCYDESRLQKIGRTLEEAKRKHLMRETDQVAAEIGREVKSWDTAAAIRKVRQER